MIGDGIRRNVAHVTQAERDRFVAAIQKLDHQRFFPDGVSYWDKQEDIHKNAHAAGANVHGGPAFIPWHRELCNRLEALMREVDPDLSLHYWDWTVDPRHAPDGAGGFVNLCSAANMGGTGDPVGAPFADFESTEPGHTVIWRSVGAADANPDGTPAITSDANIKNTDDFATLDSNMRAPHGSAHFYIGGTLTDAHFSFHDPFVFLLHSNLDRIWAEWQTDPAHPARLEPATAYGSYSSDPAINEDIQPWAGDVGTGATPLRPWAAPDNQQLVKTYKDVSVVTPPCYDTLPTTVRVVMADNPGMQVRFTDVPQGETAIRAAVFEVRACDEITLRLTAPPSAPFSLHYPLSGSVPVPHHPQLLQVARMWFSFTGGTPGLPVPSSDVTVHCDETGQDFVFHLTANSIARPTVATMLVLDRSGSMGELAGIDPTTKRIDILHQAASTFVNLVQDQNGVGLVSFNEVAHPGVALARITGGVFDPARATALAAIQAIAPGGATSIGNGLQLGRTALDSVVGYDRKALIVFTDGLENTPLWISDEAALINDRTFAIGLGTAQQVSAGALTSLAHQTQGYLLLSGPLSPAIDDTFRLTKYFLQVLAGVTNTDIVTDPSGYVGWGEVQRIPFQLCETDIDATVILLSDSRYIEFGVETPDGTLMTAASAPPAGALFRVATGLQYFRFNLPLVLAGTAHHSGTWHAVIGLGGKRFTDVVDRLSNQTRPTDTLPVTAPEAMFQSGGPGTPYSVSVQCFSNLRMRAQIAQSSVAPGAILDLTAALSEYGVPVDHRARVEAVIESPSGIMNTVPLVEYQPGVFTMHQVAPLAGVYRFRVRAAGGTMRGKAFTREQLLSSVVVEGGDQLPPKSTDGRTWTEICSLVTCLLEVQGVRKELERMRVDVSALERCLKTLCAGPRGGYTAKDWQRLEGTAAASVAPVDAQGQLLTHFANVLADIVRSVTLATLRPDQPASNPSGTSSRETRPPPPRLRRKP